MKLLLHTCCAPCLIYPLKQLQKEGFEVAGFFYNPNIHPLEEYNRRKEAVMEHAALAGLEVFYPDYQPDEFLRVVGKDAVFPHRCPVCWELRLKNTALEAKRLGFTHFSTTLLVSPYQDQDLLRGIGESLEEEENVNFYCADFRPGFHLAHNQAKAQGIYCQKYCGCMFSEQERCQKSAKR